MLTTRFNRSQAAALALSGTLLFAGQSAVTLAPQASPALAQAGITTVSVTGSGYPGGVLLPADVTVMIEPAGGGPVTAVGAAGVQQLGGTAVRVTFTIPSPVVVAEPEAYLISVTGSNSGGAFGSVNKAAVTIEPGAQITGMSPAHGEPGTSIQVALTGMYTTFLAGATMANFGAGVSVGGAPAGMFGPVTVTGPTTAVADVTIAASAPVGPQTVMVATGAQEAMLANGFTVGPVFTVLHSFSGGSGDGANPKRDVLIGPGAILYGTTVAGGASNNGTVYAVMPPASPGNAWTSTVLYSFGGTPDGMKPDGILAMTEAGIFYGTTAGGGANGNGTVFSLAPPGPAGGPWTESILYNFMGADGAEPYAGVTMGPNGGLYGSTFYGGAGANGVVYELAPAAGGGWNESVLERFNGADGSNLHSPVIFANTGAIYGTTYNGGSAGNGVAYELVHAAGGWSETVLHDFGGPPNDGAHPHAYLVPGPGGAYYSTTLGGGAANLGTVFSLAPPQTPGGTWTATVVYSFSGPDGAQPRATLAVGSDGSLYGTTYLGGPANLGTVYRLTPPLSAGGPWTEAVLHSFTGVDGANPEAGLAMGMDGTLYGATFNGGASGNGTIFAVQP